MTKELKTKTSVLYLFRGLFMATAIFMSSCNRNNLEHNASGTFEAREIIVSSEAQGKVEMFNVQEGDWLEEGQYIGYIDTIQLNLKRRQLEAAVKAISVRKPSVNVQMASLKEQLTKAEREYDRVKNLHKGGAATDKQLDDAEAQVIVLKKSIDAQKDMLNTSVSGLDEEMATYKIQIEQVEDMLSRSYIHSPIKGRVLNKYIEQGELAGMGTPLLKIADTKDMFIRVYVVAAQLGEITLGQDAKVYTNESRKNDKHYDGRVVWISDKAEFTPKTIQTKDEREHLVYAVKIAVQNTDDLLKIGMYGDVSWNTDDAD